MSSHEMQTQFISRIRVRREDYPPEDKGHYPPDSAAFDQLKRAIKRNGLLTPVFIDAANTCVSGHYRLWAAESLGVTKVPVVIVAGLTWEKKLERCLEWFEQQSKAA